MLSELYNTAKKKVEDYFAPTSQVRARDIVRELPGGLMQTYNNIKSGNVGKSISDSLGQTAYFKPTNEVRTRDFVRELPLAVDKTTQGVAQAATRFGISAYELPQTFKTGQASGKFYNTPFGRLNSIQSEAQNRVNNGQSPIKAIAHGALDTALGASDFAAAAKPLLNSAKSLSRFGKVGQEVSNIASDLTQPMMTPVQRNFRRTFTKDYATPLVTKGAPMRTLSEPQSIVVQKTVNRPTPFKSQTLNMRPGMTIENAKKITKDTSYRIQHQISEGISVSDLNNIDDIVKEHKIKNGYLTNYDLSDLKKLRNMNGNPEMEIKIYRSSPIGELNSGDWVTTSKTYANDIKRQNGGKVYEYNVKVKDLIYPKNIDELPSLARFSAFKYKPRPNAASGEGFQPKSKLFKGLQNQGLSIKDVSGENHLIQEAKKYKTAEEFVKAQVGDKFGSFNKIDINARVEQPYISPHSGYVGDFATKKTASGLSYSSAEKMNALASYLRQGGRGNTSARDFRGIYSLDKVINNDALFSKYPQLKNYNVVFADFHTPTRYGVRVDDTIFINAKLYDKNPAKIESTIIHEIQHAKQGITGKNASSGEFKTYAEKYNNPSEIDARAKQDQFIKYRETKSQLTDIWNQTNKSLLPGDSHMTGRNPMNQGMILDQKNKIPTPVQQKAPTIRSVADNQELSLNNRQNVSYPENNIKPQVNQEPLLLANKQPQLALPPASRKYIPSGETINLTEDAKFLNPETARQSVIQNLQAKYDDFERGLYGNAASELQGGSKGQTQWQSLVRPMREGLNSKIQQGLSSDNSTIRNISRGIRGLMGGAGNTAERTSMRGAFKGGVDESRNLANDFQKLGDEMLPDKLSREKVWALLDPELAGIKVTEAHLSPEELKAVDVLRKASDLINDQNFAMGKISHEAWLKGRGGRYITRAYEDFDLPVELSEAFSGGKGKLDLGSYKGRTEITDWKQENAIKDPFYLAAKRIQSTFSNKAITDYGNWISKQADMISDVPRAGYTQVSENHMWGALSGKNVRHDVLEDIKGFYSDNKILQGLYDGLNAYDRNVVRQTLKKTKTVYNPATRLGNQTSNRVFAIFNGINPITFEKNMQTFAKQELANNGRYARVLRQNGILGTDMTKFELVKNLAGEGQEVGKLGKFDNAVSSSYGAADDKAKISAFKYWLDKGKTVDEALNKVRSGFQDYSKVGQFYDIGAKLPVVGKPFIRFQSELARIIKNSLLENPLRVPLVVGSIALMGEMGSIASGETPEDKRTREGRFGTPVVPFTNIPLRFQTPIGEVNAARMFGMYETAGADTNDKNVVQRASKYLPIDIPTNADDAMKMTGNDVMLGGIANQIFDRDFRGKSISDPEQSKYQPSTLTSGEKLANRAGALYHNYQLPFFNDVENVGRAAIDKPNIYGSKQTVLQAASRLTGFKVEQYGSEQAKEQRIKDQQFAQYKKDDIKKNINAILKDQQAGKIDFATAQARIENQQKQLEPNQNSSLLGNSAQASTDTRVVKNPSGGFSYTDANGDFKTAKTQKEAERAVAKIDFENSDENFKDLGDVVLRKNADGVVRAQRKDGYNAELSKSKMANYKNSKNIKSWLKEADILYKNYAAMIKDPNIDESDRLKIQNEIDTLAEQFSKFKDYGGFTKGGSGSSKAKYQSLTDSPTALINSLRSQFGNNKDVSRTFSIPTSRQTRMTSVARKQNNLIRI